MGSQKTVLPVVALLSLLSSNIVHGQIPGAGKAEQDPIAFFAGLAQLPEDQQDAFLRLAGEQMMKSNADITCNIFGGEDSCQDMKKDSAFATTCQSYRPDLKVDCAYYSASEEHLDMHPGDALNKFLGDAYTDVSQHCPQCVASLQALWCVQALPECGSFQTHVHKAIFPAIVEAKKEEDKGQPPSIAMAEAIPGLVRAMSKTMACKEMCEAAVKTCSCKEEGEKTLTFGEAIENAEQMEDSFSELGLQTLGEDFRDTLFKEIWDQPLCDIFTSKDDAEFAGTCDDDIIGDKAQCSSSAFCDGLDDAQRAGTETIIATQMARSVFAFVEGPAGVIQQRSASTAVVKDGSYKELPVFKKPGIGVTPPSTTPTPSPTPIADSTGDAVAELIEVPPPEQKKRGSTFGAIFGTLMLLAVIAGGAWFGWQKYQEHQARRYGDYGPMEAYGDDGIPLQ